MANPSPATGGQAAAPAWSIAVLTPEGLEHIANHQYKAGKYTPLDNLLNPWWLKLTDWLPMWFAPNLVTFAGFLPMGVTYALIWIYSPDFATPVPRWVALFTSLATFFYQTMDAMDGKQARRTGASSPLGQLFDHGCDCLACLAFHSIAGMATLSGAGFYTLGVLATLQSCFFLAQWQERYTGVLRTSFGPVGVTEMQYSLILAALLTALAGPDRLAAITSAELGADVLPGGGSQLGPLAAQGWNVFCGVMATISLVQTLGHIWSHSRHLVARAALDMLPVLAMDALLVLLPRHVFRRSPRMVCLVTGLLFFYYTAQMILFSMAKMHFPAWQPTLLLFAVLVCFARVAPEQEAVLAAAFMVVAWLVAFVVARWLLSAIQELKGKLGICVFTIPIKTTTAKAA